MNSAIEPVALMLLRQGRQMTKYDLAVEARCDQRTAHRVFTRLHTAQQDVRIVGWAAIYRRMIPIWGLGTRDKPKPAPVNNTKYMRQKRKHDVEFYMNELAYKRKIYARVHAPKEAL